MKPVRQSGKDGSKTPSPRLSDSVDQEVLGFLHVAEKSSYPEIRAAAIEMAKEAMRDQRHRKSQMSPHLVAVLATAMVVAAVAGSWIAVILYQWPVARLIVYVILFTLLLILALYLVLSGHLSQDNFMGVLKLIFGPLLRVFGFPMPKPEESDLRQGHQSRDTRSDG